MKQVLHRERALPAVQGFYVFDADDDGVERWRASNSVPVDHLMRSGRWGLLRRDFAYVDARGVPHVAEIGLAFDGLSIPWLLRPVCGGPWGKYLAAGAIHDHDCAVSRAEGELSRRVMLRAQADERFAEMLRFLGAAKAVAGSWKKAVQTRALWARFGKLAPDYRVHLGEYYAFLGIDGLVGEVSARRRRHEVHA